MRLARAVLPNEEEFVAAIEKDPRWGPIYRFLTTGAPPESAADNYAASIEPFYCVDDGMLLVYTGQKKAQQLGPEAITVRIVVPDSLKGSILAYHHNRPEAGHVSEKGTYARFCHLFWWPGMWKDTVKYV